MYVHTYVPPHALLKITFLFRLRKVLLQDITPDEVLVTPRWEALLRPNYAHAREGYAWTTVSVRETAVREVRQQRQRLHGSSLGLDSEPLTALFSDTISPNYQARSKENSIPPEPQTCGGVLTGL